MAGRRSHGSRGAILLILFLFAALAVAVYIAGSVWFTEHFYSNSTINGVAVGGLTGEEAVDEVKKSVEEYSLTVHFRDGDDVVLTADEVGMEYGSSSKVQMLLDTQNALMWPVKIGQVHNYDFSSMVSYSDEAIVEALSEAPQMDTDKMVRAKAAKMVFEDGTFAVEEGVAGNELDPQVAASAVTNAVLSGETDIDLDETQGVYAQPADGESEEALREKADEYNLMLSSKIVYDLPESSVVLDSSTLLGWLKKNKDGSYSYDEETWNDHINEFVAKMATEADTIGKDRVFSATGLGDIYISGTSEDGYELDQLGEAERLREDLRKGVNTEREPYYLSLGDNGDGNHGFGTTYVEIDLSRQHLWVYYDGSLMAETDVVSGNMSDGHATPEGVFRILDKETDATLKGDIQVDGSFGYQSKVKFWMPITVDGVGLHDASWRSAFGGSIYQTNGSHGCINLPPQNAEKIFNLVDGSMPVIVYYSNGS